jgi:proton-translocating NADH-quinone oxidoreductase chain L
MPTPAILLLVATLLPLAGFALLLFVGKRMGTPLAGYVGTAIIALSFICSIWAMIDWVGSNGIAGNGAWGFGKGPINLPIRWLPIGTPARPAGIAQEIPGWLDVGIFVDSLTITMFAMVTLVATLVHIFSIGYMQEDGRYPRFFAYLGLFCFSMLGLVLGGTLLHILIFWELVGFCSYLLIGFWYEKKTANNAAIKAFVTNRVGDVGLLIGLGILFCELGNVTLPHLWLSLGRAGGAGAGRSILLPDGNVFTSGWLTVMGIGLIFGAIGKSAQFPLHVWLADAMEGPTPVSALIHAATMVAAGVYLLGRVFPILTPDAKMFLAIIGVITLGMGALIAIAQTDIKKILAFSTMSQLGYMMLAMGVGSWVGGLFHLIAHAFFKALLFLGAGSVIRAAHHEQELGEFGGLIRKIPVTAFTFLVGVLAISGVGYGKIGLSGYYSKEMILSQTAAFADLAIHLGHSHYFLLLFAVPAIVSFLTPFYMMRCWMLTFWGKARQPQLYEHARETPVMWGPLALLAIIALLSGRFMGIQELLEASVTENNQYCRQYDSSFAGFDTAWPASLTEDRSAEAPRAATDALTLPQRSELRGHAMVESNPGVWGFTIGIVLAIGLYYRGLGIADFFLKIPPVRWVRNWLFERMWFDELYFGVFVATVPAFSALCAWLDKKLIDRAVNGAANLTRRLARGIAWADDQWVDGAVMGTAALAGQLGNATRAPQTGRIRGYAMVMIGTTALAIAAAVVVALSR